MSLSQSLAKLLKRGEAVEVASSEVYGHVHVFHVEQKKDEHGHTVAVMALSFNDDGHDHGESHTHGEKLEPVNQEAQDFMDPYY